MGRLSRVIGDRLSDPDTVSLYISELPRICIELKEAVYGRGDLARLGTFDSLSDTRERERRVRVRSHCILVDPRAVSAIARYRRQRHQDLYRSSSCRGRANHRVS